ncbi:hypothetical protein COO60DRAFT_332269 [Scenedesmus sp. NREL 46B-D3]|nr:hypothetical protein COO60DRAFT_332269 [Scenedesmus sp. NREL 46B-D3]
MQCYLLPPLLLSKRRSAGLAEELSAAVHKAAAAARSEAAQAAAAVRSLVEAYRFCDISQQPQPRWQQQRRAPGELLLQDISVTKLGKGNKPDAVIAATVKLLEAAVSAAYPPLYLKSYVMKNKQHLHHSVVLTRDATQLPDYSAGLDHTKPWKLKFALPDAARELLQQQLPLLKKQQLQLQQQAAAQGLQLQIGSMAGGVSSSSHDDTGAATEPAQQKEKTHRRPGGVVSPA